VGAEVAAEHGDGVPRPVSLDDMATELVVVLAAHLEHVAMVPRVRVKSPIDTDCSPLPDGPSRHYPWG
jgi:hypothetical protein